MLRYIIFRLIGLVGVLFVASVITFSLMHAVPGGPFDEEKMPLSAEAKANILRKYGLDKPLHEQYARYMWNALHFDFGIWESYHPFNKRITLGKANGAWRLSPYLGGDFIKGRATSYWTHIRVPVRIHMTGFDIVADPRAQTAVMENLQTAIELFDRRGGRLLPFPTGIRIGITEGQPTDQASREIQGSVNTMIAQAFADARTKTRAQALQKFPLAALFIDK